MQLILDAGNTFVKAALFEGQELKNSIVLGDEDLLPASFFQCDKAILSSVRSEVPTLVRNLPMPLVHLDGKTPLPFRNLYRTPETLGPDRIANAAGAWNRHPGRNVLVMDAGTCLKIDLILAEGAYAGGSISPGLSMRYQAMNAFTGKLPRLNPVASAELTGNDTASSMHSGVINGMSAEIDGIISRYQEMYPELICLITGGDHAIFSGKLKSLIFAAPSLTLEGLNTILLHLSQ